MTNLKSNQPQGFRSKQLANTTERRLFRGLSQTAKSWLVNADAKGAACLLKKVAAMLGIKLSRVSRGFFGNAFEV